MSNPNQQPTILLPPQTQQADPAQSYGYGYGPSTVPMNAPTAPGYVGTPMNASYPTGPVPPSGPVPPAYSNPGYPNGPYPPNGTGPYNSYPYVVPNQAPQKKPDSAAGLALAIVSLSIGILGAIFCCLGISNLDFLIPAAFLGIMGIVAATISKKLGYKGTVRTAGFAISIVALSVSAVILITCFGCVASSDSSSRNT